MTPRVHGFNYVCAVDAEISALFGCPDRRGGALILDRKFPHAGLFYDSVHGNGVDIFY